MHPVVVAPVPAFVRDQAALDLLHRAGMSGTTIILSADLAGVARAAAELQAGKLVAFPTETVYGLGADARSGDAVASIYVAKGRPRFNPLIAHVACREAAQAEGHFSEVAEALAAAFWPGPLTLVVPARSGCGVSSLARAGLDSVALRVPDHPVALALLRSAGFPIAAPSANRSGRISPTAAAHVSTELDGRVDYIVEGGPASVGLESTVVSCLDAAPRILRPGGLPRAAIEQVLGCRLVASASDQALLSPGMLASHYAPAAHLRLEAISVRSGEAVLDFAGRLREGGARERLDLSSRGSLREAAANLFDFLRRLDATGAAVIAVAPIPNEGLGEAINDRLGRAASPRS